MYVTCKGCSATIDLPSDGTPVTCICGNLIEGEINIVDGEEKNQKEGTRVNTVDEATGRTVRTSKVVTHAAVAPGVIGTATVKAKAKKRARK